MNLNEYRESLNLNKKQMAKEIGVSASYYYKIEAEQRTPSYEFLTKLKNRFPSVSIDKLFFSTKKVSASRND